MWQDEAYSQREIDNYMIDYEKGNNVGKTGSWHYAKEYCQNLTLNGFNDWRVPTINELDEIKDKRDSFTNIISRGHWSSSNKNSKQALAFTYKYYDEGKNPKLIKQKNSVYYIKCVRDIK